MDINLLIGIVGLALSVGSFVYAVYERKKGVIEKKLVYEVIPPVPVAEVLGGKGTYSLKVVYERQGDEPVYIENAYLQLIRFTNFGKDPITKNDIALIDPLRVEVKHGSVFDISLLSETRGVCQIRLNSLTSADEKVSVNINFEFLDHLDGGLVQILSDSADLEISLKGTIVGMPKGLEEAPISTDAKEIPNWGCGLGVFLEVLALSSVPIVYKNIVGSWNNVWLLLLPIAALALPWLVFSLVMIVFSSREKFRFPKQLLPPRWYQIGSGWYFPPYREKALKEKQKLIAEIDLLKKQLDEKK